MAGIKMPLLVWLSSILFSTKNCLDFWDHHTSLLSPSPSHLLPISRCVFSLHSRSHCDAWHRRQRKTEHFSSSPPSVGSLGCYRWRTLSVALRQKFATSFSWLHEYHSERCMGTHKMIVSSPPLQMGEQVWALLSCGPGPAS